MMSTLLNNRYRVIDVLGTGGFGTTYLAEDTHMPSSRRCAIKQLKPMTNNPQVYQIVQDRFKREAAILEELGESNNQIPRLYAYFEAEGQFYLVQEWIEGETLTQKLQHEGRQSETSVKEILLKILPALEYVHSRRIVHRDIKPDNIILRHSNNVPVLIDFGAVREIMGTIVTSGENTTPSIIIGTPGFMASEQSTGRPVYASDLYSLGLTAIYLLTGKTPQALEIDPVTRKYIWEPLTLGVSRSFATILDKAIQSHPRDRFITAREMLEALKSDVPATIPYYPPTLPPPPPPLPTPLPPTVISSPPAVIQSTSGDWKKAVAIGSVIGVSVVAGLIFLRPQFSPTQPDPTPTIAQSSPSPSISPETPIATNSISQVEAVALVNQWLEAKKVMFAPPYNRQPAIELTTGNLYQNTIKTNGSIDWLEKHNARYQYRVQKIEGVDRFIINGDRATLAVRVTEDLTYFENEQIDPNKSGSETLRVSYDLQLVEGQWKISDLVVAK